MHGNPRSWGRYRRLVEAGSVAEIGDLNRFAARYRMACTLSAVTFDGLSEPFQEGYAAGLRVGLAYSAYEALVKATGRDMRHVEIRDEALANRLRDGRHGPLHRLLRTPDPRGKTLLREVEEFLGGASDDVRPVAAKLRHLVFHGVYTPTAAGAGGSTSVRSMLRDLAGAVTSAADADFTRWLDAQP